MHSIINNIRIKIFAPHILKHCKVKSKPKYYSIDSIPLQDASNTKTEHETKSGRISTVNTLERLFNLNKFDAFSIASKYKILCTTSPKTLSSNYILYKSKKINVEIILEYPDLLAEKNASEKIEELEKVGLSLNDIFPLLKLDYDTLKHFINDGKPHCMDTIKYMSLLFGKPIRTTCGYMASKPFLLHMDLDKLAEKITVLKEFGITNDDIAADLWVLRYTMDIIRERLGDTKERNVETVKTWMVRAPADIMNRYVKRRSDNKLILGNHSLAEYLSERLDCTVQQANYLISKHPALENKSLKKTQEIIDFLYSYGFKPFHICRVPKILLHSVETTRKRLKELKNQGLQIDSLSILTKSQKQYMQYCEGLVKSNKMKNKG